MSNKVKDERDTVIADLKKKNDEFLRNHNKTNEELEVDVRIQFNK